MKTLLVAVALVVPAAAFAQNTAAPRDDGFHARLFERYCEKLRESPEAYVQFVRRLQPVHGLTVADFAPEQKGAPVRADCRASPARVAEVHRTLAQEKR